MHIKTKFSNSITNINTWVQSNNRNDYILQIIQVTNNKTVTLYNMTGDVYLELKSNKMSSGKSVRRITNFLYNGGWTFFSPGFSFYGPSLGKNNGTGNTIAPPKTTTLRKNG